MVKFLKPYQKIKMRRRYLLLYKVLEFQELSQRMKLLWYKKKKSHKLYQSTLQQLKNNRLSTSQVTQR